MNKRYAMWIALPLFCALCMLTFGVLHLIESKKSLADAYTNTKEVYRLCATIEQLRGESRQAVSSDERKAGDTRHILDLLPSSKIPVQSVQKLESLGMKRIEKSEYLRDDVSLTIASITMTQAAEFCIRCAKSDAGYVVTQIRLSRPKVNIGIRSTDSPSPTATDPLEHWDVELLLTRLVYQATNPSPKR